jgi:O-methyltransferase/aklanonic acid methyltransferase
VVPFFATFAADLLRLLDPAPGTRLVDIGAGRGAIAGAAAAAGCAVTAVDAAPRMVALLAAAHPDMEVRRGDARALDLPDASYDLATLGFVIHIVADPPRVLAEVRRVLRPGGTVALSVPGGTAPGSERWGGFHALIQEFAKRADPARLPGGPFDVAAGLHAAGFTGVRTANIEVHLPVADPVTGWRFHMSHGFAGLVEALGPADAAELRDRAMVELHRMHSDGGVVIHSGAVVHLATAPGSSGAGEPPDAVPADPVP